MIEFVLNGRSKVNTYMQLVQRALRVGTAQNTHGGSVTEEPRRAWQGE